MNADSNSTPRHDASGVTLNANQRRHYEVLFSGLERTLTTLEAAAANSLAEVPDERAIFSAPVSDLPPGFAPAASPVFETIRERLRQLKSELALSARPVSQRHTCRALVTSEISRVEESYARSLRGYGEVDPTVAELLDPALREIRDALADVGALLRQQRPDAQ